MYAIEKRKLLKYFDCTHSHTLTHTHKIPFKPCGIYEKLIIGVNVALLKTFPKKKLFVVNGVDVCHQTIHNCSINKIYWCLKLFPNRTDLNQILF